MAEAPDSIVCEIVGMTSGGAGVARHAGKVVFVPGALVGERVCIEIVQRGARFDRARLVAVEVAAGRQETPCRHDHAGGCGGCSLLHATRAAQADAKRLMVADALVRLAGQDAALVRAVRTPGPDLGYRNHARFGVSPDGRLTYVAKREEPAFPARPGGRATPRRRADGGDGPSSVVIDTCVVLHPRLDALRGALAGKVRGCTEVELRIGARTGDRLVVLHGVKKCPEALDATRIEASIVLEHDGTLAQVRGTPWVHEVVLGKRFRVSAPSFFQVNADGAECLAELVRASVGASPPGRALDLYAGVGLFTVLALDGAKSVLAVEIDPASSDDFRHNVAALAGARLRTEPASDVLRDLRPGRDRFDVAVINPPRAGMGDAVIRALVPLSVPRLVLVSCDAGSLARDVAALVNAGYVLREATPVDQFPGTPHVETVAVLERAG